MKRLILLVSALAMVASACGSGETKGMQSAETDLGSVLVDGSGFTLYVFLRDEPGTSSCIDDCAVAWPPYRTDELGVSGAGIDAALVGEIIRADGDRQVTYDGKPLYRYAADAPGGIAGQGVNDVWFVIGVDGNAVGVPQPEVFDRSDY